MTHCVRLLSLTLVAALVAPRDAVAQLAPKRVLAASAPQGCAALAPPARPISTSPLGEDAETRRLISDGQEASLQGDHAAARDAFAQAARRSPQNALLAYYLAREHEALKASTDAVREYCRYLLLSPTARDFDDVQGRIVRLSPQTELARVDEARASFSSGVALLERRQYVAADSMFGRILPTLPNEPSIYFNRALARAARGDRALATDDFEKYLELTPDPADRIAIRTAVSRLQDRVYGSGQAFLSGLFPGMGQMSTGRPVLGVAVLGAVSGAIIWGMTKKEGFEVSTFQDPFGNSYVDSLPRTTMPNFPVAAATAGILWFGSAFEAMNYARRTRARAESIIQFGAPVTGSSEAYAGIGPSGGRVGLKVRLR